MIEWQLSLWLIPVAAIGHIFGLKMHDKIIHNDALFKRWVGGALFVVSLFGLLKIVV